MVFFCLPKRFVFQIFYVHITYVAFLIHKPDFTVLLKTFPWLGASQGKINSSPV